MLNEEGDNMEKEEEGRANWALWGRTSTNRVSNFSGRRY
jgi:hypothetical protein